MISEELFKISERKKIPLYTVFELTYRCNLSCIHCYISEHFRKSSVELLTLKIKSVIEEIASLGGLYIVFTGGEPLLRDDIFSLCRYAKKLNFVVILFTNGTLLTEKVVSKIKHSGVDKVEVSLYGTRDVHDFITRSNGSFNKTLLGIKLLLFYGIKVSIKTPLMKLNYKDYSFLTNLSKELGIECKFDIVITPGNDGSLEPVKYNLPRNLIKKMFNPMFIDYKKKLIKTVDVWSHIICSAGRNVVGINPEGKVYPCIQFPYCIGDVSKENFTDIWYSQRWNFIRYPKLSKYKTCVECKELLLCTRCPGLAFVEAKDVYGCSSTSKRLVRILKS